MIDMEELKRKAAAEIRSAFPDAEPPSLADMRNDHCLECQETVRRFAGKRWMDIAVQDLVGNPGPGFLTDTGVRYYLPAMMLHSIEAERELDCFPDSVVGLLSPAGGKPSERNAARLSGYPQEQVKAILAFLRYREAREEIERSEPPGRVVTRAIKYWERQFAGDAP